MFVFCDANSTMGSVVSQHVSSHGAAPDNVNSHLLPHFFSNVACLSRLPFRSSIPVHTTPILPPLSKATKTQDKNDALLPGTNSQTPAFVASSD